MTHMRQRDSYPGLTSIAAAQANSWRRVAQRVNNWGVINPALCGVRGEGKVNYDILVDLVVEVEEDAEASMCKDGMCGFGENVII
jgi:hypothetical protein